MGSKYIYVYYYRVGGLEKMNLALTLVDVPDDVLRVEKYSYDKTLHRAGWEEVE